MLPVPSVRPGAWPTEQGNVIESEVWALQESSEEESSEEEEEEQKPAAKAAAKPAAKKANGAAPMEVDEESSEEEVSSGADLLIHDHSDIASRSKCYGWCTRF